MSNPARLCNVDILSPFSLTSYKEKADVIELVNAEAAIAPESFGYCEPIRERFDVRKIPIIIGGWSQQFLWKKRSRPSIEGSAWSDWSDWPIHSSVVLWTTAYSDQQEAIQRFVTTGAELLKADFAYLHIVGEDDLVRGETNGTISSGLILVSTHKLIRYIPDLYWLTVFGSPYVEGFGRERLLSAPAHRVTELEYGGIMLQLSESPMDFVTDPVRLATIRRDVKQYLNPNAFFDESLPTGHTYDVPQFRLRERRAEWSAARDLHPEG